jgi:transposase
MEPYSVGLDVHSRQSTFVIQDAAGHVVAHGAVPTTRAALASWRAEHQLPVGTPVALETGTVAFFVARQLAALELRPVVVDAHEVRLKAYRPTQKSDRRDAAELCEGVRRGIYRAIVHVPDAPVVRLRATLARRRHFVRLQTAQVAAVKALLRAAGLGALSRSLGTDVGWAKMLAALTALPMHADLATHVEQHRALWRCARDQVAVLDAALAELERTSFAEPMRRLQTIPGVGPIVAATALAVFADVHRFPGVKQAASYAGLVPATYQSGDRDAHGRITQRGAAELRAMLCEAAHHAHRPTHPLHPYFAPLCARRGYKMAVVAVAHRLCRIMVAMLRDAHDFDVTKLAVERGPFARTRVYLYRRKPASRRA